MTSNRDNFAIITGAYGGLGKALAHIYAEADYGLILLGRDQASLDELKKELSAISRVIAIKTDVSDWDSCQNAFREIEAKNLYIKALINNAGITYINKMDATFEIKQFKKVIATNLNGPVYMSKLFLKDLIDNKGSLINISSVLGYAPLLGRTAYVTSKFGLEGFSSVLRAETGNKLHLLMVYPTFFKSNIRDGIKGDKTVNEVLNADFVAKRIFKAHMKGKEKLFLGKTAKVSYYLYKFWPKIYVKIMCKKVEMKF